MKPATFHNAVLTLTSAYAEALAETDALRAAAEERLQLVRQARPVSPRVLDAAKALLVLFDDENRRVDPGRSAAVELDELRAAVAELEPR